MLLPQIPNVTANIQQERDKYFSTLLMTFRIFFIKINYYFINWPTYDAQSDVILLIKSNNSKRATKPSLHLNQ